jgi:type II restriction/modification system DNA methylase subunit YeeA
MHLLVSECVKLKKKLSKLQAKENEIRIYEKKIHHIADQMISIDLDDGVKKNYAIFQDVLAKIK